MGRVLLTYFHQLLLREKPISTFTNADEAVRVFGSLVTEIQKLESSLAENSLSLQWCTGVLNLLRKVHFHFLCFVQQFEPTVLLCIEEYMKESLILLDFCNSLKSAISEMNRYRLVVDVAAEKLRTASAKSEIERLEREGKKLYVMDDHKGKIFNLFNQEIMSKTKEQRCEGLNGINKNCGKPVLVENKMVESTVFHIKNQTSRRVAIDEEKYMMSIDLLKNNAIALKEGLEMFESAVTELFEEAVKGRNKVLAMIAAV
ncbi:hypothetical protein PTKIN_Ptkin09bG0074700 [Pterospermum kingtungense]